MRLETLSKEEWADALPSSGFGVFHTPEALEVLDAHTSSELHLVGAFKGERPVALVPLFRKERSIGTAMLSPPPSLAVPNLGPLLMPASPKRRKRERLHKAFANEVLEFAGVERSTTILWMSCDLGMTDPRPYVWADLDVNPRFTYVLDLSEASTDRVMERFSKSLRRDVRNARASEVTVDHESTTETARRVFEDTRNRYDEQDERFGLTWDYVRDLTEGLGERCRVYVARDGSGEYLGGITVLYSNDRAYFWQGGTRTDHDVAINCLLHWRILEDVATDPPLESVNAYDLMGANTEQICRYKSKYGADLRTYYTVESSGPAIDVAKTVYNRL